MKTERFTILVFVVAVTILTLFTASKAAAFSDEPCYGWNYDCDTCMTQPGCLRPQDSRTVTNAGWNIRFVGISQPDNFKPNWWKWHYQIWNTSTGTQSGLNVAAWLIPDCCKSPKVLFSTGDAGLSIPTNLTQVAVGAGEVSTGFGKWIQSAFVLRGTPVGGTIDWYLAANTNHKTISTVFLKLKSAETSFEIEVPGCTPAPAVEQLPIGGRTHSECINTGQETTSTIPGYEFPATNDDISFYIVRNMDRDGCVANIWACRGLYCPNCTSESCSDSLDCDLLTGEQQGGTTILEASLLRSCPDENFSVKTGSPYYLYTWNSGGITYKKCLNLSNGLWMPSLDCCTTKTGYCP